jgi:DNA-binding response OmpR family regulator
MKQILLIEDSPEYQVIVKAALKDRAIVTCVSEANAAQAAISHMNFDMILLDVGLPGKDGLLLCEELRQDERLRGTPILLVTGRKETSDLVLGFEAGADDYICKPFHPDELRARVAARLKKHEEMKAQVASGAAAQQGPEQFTKGELCFMVWRQAVSEKTAGRDRDLELTPNEFKILYHLAKNESRILSRSEILREVWGENLHVVERTVDKHICSLRRKMGQLASYVASVPGEGYTFSIDPVSQSVRVSGFGSRA